jgi:hypothetical protein
VRDAIDEYGRRRAGISASVEHKSSLDLYDPAVCICVVSHEDGCWVAMHMSEEAFFSAVLHLDRATSLESKQTTMNLQTDVFASTECSANATECESYFFRRQIKACRNLCEIFVQPLSSYM